MINVLIIAQNMPVDIGLGAAAISMPTLGVYLIWRQIRKTTDHVDDRKVHLNPENGTPITRREFDHHLTEETSRCAANVAGIRADIKSFNEQTREDIQKTHSRIDALITSQVANTDAIIKAFKDHGTS